MFLTIAELLADRLDISVAPHRTWNTFLSASTNFERYLRREVFPQVDSSLVLGLDEVDRLFAFDYASEVFGLFRSWHNLRALDPDGPWSRLTLAMAYATEAHLFITDLNQSPFNVGTRLILDDFTPQQTIELNKCYGSPIRDEAELARFRLLVGGHPYLSQRSLYEIARSGASLEEIDQQADQDEGIFGDHLKRILISLDRNQSLREELRNLIQQGVVPSKTSFYRLRSAGVLAGNSPSEAKPRCDLYRRYLNRNLL